MLGSNHKNAEENRTELFFQPESCVISHAAKQLMDIVHDVLAVIIKYEVTGFEFFVCYRSPH